MIHKKGKKVYLQRKKENAKFIGYVVNTKEICGKYVIQRMVF